MALADVLDLTSTDGYPLCPDCSDEIIPGEPHNECEHDGIAQAKIGAMTAALPVR